MENCVYKNGSLRTTNKRRNASYENLSLEHSLASQECAHFSTIMTLRIVYRRLITVLLGIREKWLTSSYASLYFLCAIEENDNELYCLELIHRFVELLDRYFECVRHLCL